jgi:hypothetical protein
MQGQWRLFRRLRTDRWAPRVTPLVKYLSEAAKWIARADPRVLARNLGIEANRFEASQPRDTQRLLIRSRSDDRAPRADAFIECG